MDGHHAMNAERKAEFDRDEYLQSLPGNPDNQEFYPGEEASLKDQSLTT